MLTIVAFGDSITQGAHIQSELAWPAMMAKFSGHQVLNAGVGGNTTQQAFSRFEQDVITRQPNVVVFEFGMNDHVYTAHGEHRVAPPQFQANLMRMAQQCIAMQTGVVFCLLHTVVAEYYYDRHPRAWYPDGIEVELEHYNQRIQAIAHDLASLVVDIPNAFKAFDPVYTTPASRLLRTESNAAARDGVHLTEDGSRVYAEAVWQALRSSSSLSRC